MEQDVKADFSKWKQPPMYDTDNDDEDPDDEEEEEEEKEKVEAEPRKETEKPVSEQKKSNAPEEISHVSSS
jgi:hypothetical protein